ncbi:MAG: hypothetical protein II393_02250 [Cytophagales bacterium]|nr:hypothetical protein [Cytophagales bacterium]
MKKSEKKKLIREIKARNEELIKKYKLDEMIQEIVYVHQADFLRDTIGSMLGSKSIELLRSNAEY